MQETLVQFLDWGDPLEKGQATHSSIHGVIWWLKRERIHLSMRETRFDPWVGKIPWRRAWQPTPCFCLENPHGQRSLADYSPWGCKQSDTTERLSTAQFTSTIDLLQLLLRCIPQVLAQCVFIFMQFKYFPFSLCIYSFIQYAIIQVSGNFSEIFLLQISNFIPLWSETILYMPRFLLNLLFLFSC